VELRAEESHQRPGVPADSAVLAQLERILASELFARSARLSAFLRFVVERTLQGQGSTLKEQVIGSQLYGKGAEFDGAADPIVRVDARRLRDKLREYYAAFPLDPVLISLPKGGYMPAFRENVVAPTTNAPTIHGDVEPNAGVEPPLRRFQWRWVGWISTLAMALGAVVTWSMSHKARGRSGVYRSQFGS
jgi:hypothetical protein